MERRAHRWRRRAVTIPAVVSATVVVIATLPVLLLVAALADVATDRRFPRTRVIAMLAIYLLCETAGLIGALLNRSHRRIQPQAADAPRLRAAVAVGTDAVRVRAAGVRDAARARRLAAGCRSRPLDRGDAPYEPARHAAACNTSLGRARHPAALRPQARAPDRSLPRRGREPVAEPLHRTVHAGERRGRRGRRPRNGPRTSRRSPDLSRGHALHPAQAGADHQAPRRIRAARARRAGARAAARASAPPRGHAGPARRGARCRRPSDRPPRLRGQRAAARPLARPRDRADPDGDGLAGAGRRGSRDAGGPDRLALRAVEPGRQLGGIEDATREQEWQAQAT